MFNVGGELSPAGFPGMRMLVWYSSTVVGCTTFTCFEARSRLLLRRPWCFFFLCFIATWRAFAVSFATFSSIRESRGSGFFRGMLPLQICALPLVTQLQERGAPRAPPALSMMVQADQPSKRDEY